MSEPSFFLMCLHVLKVSLPSFQVKASGRVVRVGSLVESLVRWAPFSSSPLVRRMKRASQDAPRWAPFPSFSAPVEERCPRILREIVSPLFLRTKSPLFFYVRGPPFFPYPSEWAFACEITGRSYRCLSEGQFSPSLPPLRMSPLIPSLSFPICIPIEHWEKNRISGLANKPGPSLLFPVASKLNEPFFSARRVDASLSFPSFCEQNWNKSIPPCFAY